MSTLDTATHDSATRTSDGGRLLRRALRLDAAASGALGVVSLAAAPALVDLLGPPAPVLVGVGAFLVVFAAGLLVLAARPVVPRPAAWTVVLGNAAWVAGSVLATVVAGSSLTGLGVAVVLVQAAAVAVFADLQWLGLRRMR
ncbi:hypothetical protein I4I73_07465 [Pseudonocardia sp. KRD-184]|uniref:Integral membrane protein n=1 Tax=Pseudonocardia oceani TaxID=2792013 RepID=A0ABS6U9H1_9PSEU|nr:hypothetical protein [Pseudonocardia oceani]MBW0089133.1 hypothetical protein [Pseudonocardia oceani]MBW0095834.1 hypothetical protein [Pseudonocardia oceani]MBW0108452.1 hypothetical protein [Pseudonocardia oceani]MBW0122591.1 hypothetical protein [Pseudonocardia oceani]MBW0128892.1 hypothetical protein [Pseudonocardia oceani]